LETKAIKWKVGYQMVIEAIVKGPESNCLAQGTV